LDGAHDSGADLSLASTISAATDPQSDDDSLLTRHGADALKQLLGTFPLRSMTDLVAFWLARGTNLALAGSFVEQCAESMLLLFSLMQKENWHLLFARRLLQQNSA
jgi:hypothetical protein